MRFALPARRLAAAALILLLAAPALAEDEKQGPPEPEPKPAAEPEPEARPEPKPEEKTSPSRADIEELVRRGGSLPEGFVPHGMRGRGGPFGGPGMESAFAQATGKLILKYLAEKDDPVRGPVYEELLGAVGTILASEEGDLRSRVPQIMGLLMRGLQDPRTRDVYSEVAQLLAGTLGPQALMGPGPAARGPEPSPATPGTQAGPTPSAWPRTLGGAQLLYRVDPVTDEVTILLGSVPPDGLAAEAALEPGDEILALDGEPATPALLRQAVEATAAGGAVEVTVRARAGERARTLLRGPMKTRNPPLYIRARESLPAAWPSALGGAQIGYRMMAHVDMPPVITVGRVPADSLAAKASLAPGDTILALDGEPADPARLGKAAAAFAPGGKLLIKLRRKDGSIDVLDLAFEAAASAADEEK